MAQSLSRQHPVHIHTALLAWEVGVFVFPVPEAREADTWADGSFPENAHQENLVFLHLGTVWAFWEPQVCGDPAHLEADSNVHYFLFSAGIMGITCWACPEFSVYNFVSPFLLNLLPNTEFSLKIFLLEIFFFVYTILTLVH